VTKEDNRPLGENSANLVTLFASKLAFSGAGEEVQPNGRLQEHEDDAVVQKRSGSLAIRDARWYLYFFSQKSKFM
jgi:hypothetical protein